MAPLLSRQPFKGVATAATIISAPAYIVVPALYYIITGTCPVPGWSIKTIIGTALLRLFYRYSAAIHIKPFYANPEKMKERHILVQPGPSEIYTGVLRHELIQPVACPAIWFPKLPATSNVADQRVVIHFQGGAFVTAPDPVEVGQVPARIFEEKLGAFTFYAQYRLARNESTRFPAALQDAITFYRYILDQGFSPTNIIISGDSAGGNLVLALLRYIEAYGILPSPKGIMAWSPWVDVSVQAPSQYKNSPRLRTDFLTLNLLQWGREAYEPRKRTKETEKYLTQVGHPFRTKTPIFINVGSAELLYEEAKTFTNQMTGIKGNRVLYVETKDAPHDIILAGKTTGFVKEAEEAAVQACEFFGLTS